MSGEQVLEALVARLESKTKTLEVQLHKLEIELAEIRVKQQEHRASHRQSFTISDIKEILKIAFGVLAIWAVITGAIKVTDLITLAK